MLKKILQKKLKKLRILSFLAFLLCFSVTIPSVVAAYIQSGTILSDVIWSGTIEITSDVTVPQNVTLRIEPGTTVTFAADAGLFIYGKLEATGSSAEPITFTSASPSPTRGIWDGIYFYDTSLDASTIEHAVIEYADIGVNFYFASPLVRNSIFSDNVIGISFSSSNSIISGCVIQNSQTYGISVSGGSNPQIVDNHIVQSNTGIYVSSTGGSNPTIRNNIIRDNGSYGIHVRHQSNATISFNTIDNNIYGIYLNLYSSNYTCTISSNIVTSNNYGIRRDGGSYSLSYNDVWGNNINYYGLAAGETDLSIDPYYVDPLSEDFRLQGGSPLLTAGGDGGEIGAFGTGGNPPLFTSPYFTTATTSGTLVLNEVWSGTVEVSADVTVPQNVTLRIEPGTTVTFAADAGLFIYGKLEATGSSAEPITFTSASPSPTRGIWDGIYFYDTSLDASTIEHAVIEYADIGVNFYFASPLVRNSIFSDNVIGISFSSSNSIISGCVIQNSQTYGISVSGGSNPQIVDNHIVQSNTGIYVSSTGGSNPTIRNNIIRDNGSYGIHVRHQSNATISFNTIDNNIYGIYLNLYSSNYTCTISSNIVTSNNYGIRRDGGSYSLSYNDVWGNNINYYGLAAGGGDISADPLFVLEEDYHLQSGSPCIDAGDPFFFDEDGTRSDMGAYGGTCIDSDNDGMPDCWELEKFGGLNQVGDGDYDNDGLTNLEEYNYGTDPTNQDTDSDGYTDKQEFDAGSDPNDPNDFPAPANQPPVISALSRYEGVVGEEVIISGSYFCTTPGMVTFNGIEAPITSWTDIEIITIVPSGATTGPVVVYTSDGIDSNEVTFTVTIKIFGQITDGHGHNLSNVEVWLRGPTTAFTFTDEEGRFLFEDVEHVIIDPGTYVIETYLKCLYEISGDTIFWIQHDNGPVVYARTPHFQVSEYEKIKRDIDFADTTLIPPLDVPSERLDDLAAIYYHIKQVIDFEKNTLDVSPDLDLPIKIRAFSTQIEGNRSGYRYGPGNNEIHIGEEQSYYEDQNRPMNREWHESFHELMHDTIGLPSLSPNYDTHLGLDNPDTRGSWIEGWAEFWSCVLKRNLGEPHPALYEMWGSRMYYLELNWCTWDHFYYPCILGLFGECSTSMEEFAVASLLWDIIDPIRPGENDFIELNTNEIWGIIGSEHLEHMKAVYDRFSSEGIGLGDTDGDGISDLDELFIAHGFFADSDRDQRYDPGEDVGWGGRPNRPNTPDIPGEYLLIDFVDENGIPITYVSLLIDVKLDYPYDIYNYSYEVKLLEEGPNLIGIGGPPLRMPAEISIRARDESGNLSDEFITTNTIYWDSVVKSTTGYANEHTFEIGTEEKTTILANVDIDPDTLKIKSKGVWITAYIELHDTYEVGDIDVSSIKLKIGKDTITAAMIPAEIGDYDSDGIADLMVKFDRGTLIQYLMNQGISSGNVTLTVDGQINANFFSGIDSIRIID